MLTKTKNRINNENKTKHTAFAGVKKTTTNKIKKATFRKDKLQRETLKINHAIRHHMDGTYGN